mmetsp:Transcript_34993/g.42151  ORF Transcript_34993/g.42151 Transcript_34993/m.42151 type:complete len:85 (-) Transcript_34993:229-483(-)
MRGDMIVGEMRRLEVVKGWRGWVCKDGFVTRAIVWTCRGGEMTPEGIGIYTIQRVRRSEAKQTFHRYMSLGDDDDQRDALERDA